MPDDAAVYKRTDDFTETTVPAGLRRDHATKAGVWGRIVVSEGRLRYEVPSSSHTFDLAPGTDGIVLPAVLHHVVPIGAVRFHVEVLRVPA
jgi:tellurite methyltransferase